MYRVAVRRDFVAQHYLIGSDWGDENQRHSHHYVLELELAGSTLDSHQYLVDIVAIERLIEERIGQYRDRTLNELPSFAGLNPSIERFAAILCGEFAERLQERNVQELTVRLWENQIAWASYTISA